MKNLVFLLMIGLFFSANVWGQSNGLPFSPTYKEKNKVELNPHLDFALGYVPKSEINAIRIRISINNILLKRLGAYTAFEKGLDSDHFSNTIGVTVTLFPFLYLWGGADLFSKKEAIKKDSGARKEIGVGIIPYKKFVAQMGYSSSVGPTFTVGYKISINSK